MTAKGRFITSTHTSGHFITVALVSGLKQSLYHIWKFPVEESYFIWVCPLKGRLRGRFTLFNKMQFLQTSKSFFRLSAN